MNSKCVQPYLNSDKFYNFRVGFLDYNTDFVIGFSLIKLFLTKITKLFMTLLLLSSKTPSLVHQSTASEVG